MEQNSKSNNWNISIIIAFIAVLISTITAYISFQESKIMLAQQKILSSQQEASVWPFLENRGYNTFSGDTMVTFKYIVKNKGVGPAILGEVKYIFDDKEFEQHLFYEQLHDKYKGKIKISQLQNSSLNKVVLAPGDAHTVITEQLTSTHDSVDISAIINEINELYRLEYCYCSVYGKCWLVSAWDKVEPSTECEFRADIR